MFRKLFCRRFRLAIFAQCAVTWPRFLDREDQQIARRVGGFGETGHMLEGFGSPTLWQGKHHGIVTEHVASRLNLHAILT